MGREPGQGPWALGRVLQESQAASLALPHVASCRCVAGLSRHSDPTLVPFGAGLQGARAQRELAFLFLLLKMELGFCDKK